MSNAALKVALYAPQIALTALAYMLYSVLSVFLVYSPPFMLAFN
jgi:hypothetical protein